MQYARKRKDLGGMYLLSVIINILLFNEKKFFLDMALIITPLF